MGGRTMNKVEHRPFNNLGPLNKRITQLFWFDNQLEEAVNLEYAARSPALQRHQYEVLVNTNFGSALRNNPATRGGQQESTVFLSEFFRCARGIHCGFFVNVKWPGAGL